MTEPVKKEPVVTTGTPVTKRIGFGILFQVDASGGSTWTTIASLVSAPQGPSSKAEVADTTILGDVYKTFLKAQIDPGEMTFSVAYEKGEASNATLITLFTQTTPTPSWNIIFPAMGAVPTYNESFSGHVIELGREMEDKKLIVRTVTIKISGTPGY